jgi:cardiolipin synthase
MTLRAFTFLLACLFSLPLFADELIVEPDAGRAPVLQFINQTQHQLNLVMYDFTDKTLLNALLQAQAQGKTVHIILEKSPYKNESLNVNTMAVMHENKLSFHEGARDFQYTHQKTMTQDNQKAMVMTFNFTLSSFKDQRNFAVVINNPELVQEINQTFNADWQEKPYISNNASLLFSPNTSRRGYRNAINAAKTSIDFYAQTVADPYIIQSLVNKANQGVSIRIITSKLPKSKALTQAGVQIHLSKKLYIHAKAMLIDNNTAIIGSVNFTPTSLDRNRELALLTHDHAVTEKLLATFNQDWGGVVSQNKKQNTPSTQAIIQQFVAFLSNQHTKRHSHHRRST